MDSANRCAAGALAVLRRAVELGVDHIDTSQYYGPDVVNELIHEALYPIELDEQDMQRLESATQVGDPTAAAEH